MKVSIISVLFILSAFSLIAAELDVREKIVGDLETLPQLGTPGPVLAFSPKAVPVVGDKNGQAILAVSQCEKGRVAVFGHNGYTNGITPETLPLMTNLASWLAGKTKADKSIRIAVYRHKPVANALNEAGFSAKTFNKYDDLSFDKPDFDILWVEANGVPKEWKEKVVNFVKNGGGWMTGATAWAVGYSPDVYWNEMVGELGISFTMDYTDGTLHGKFDLKQKLSPYAHVNDALKALIDVSKGKPAPSADDLKTISATLSSAIRFMPTQKQKPFETFGNSLGGSPLITEKEPAKSSDPIKRFLALYEASHIRSMKPGLKANPSAEFFPGPVPKDISRITKTVVIDSNIPDWHSVGLYAAPGETITIRVPDSVADSPKKWGIRIGCHQDRLWHHDKWKRFPEISYSFPIEKAETAVCNPFGGLVYIVVPKKGQMDEVSVTLENVVESPLYVLGKTTKEQWKKELEKQAPWGELATDKMIISLPLDVLKMVDDPELVMVFWNKVMDACADLAGWPHERNRPERMVPDVQISAGYMHSGYPIMTQMDVKNMYVDVPKLKKDGWGFFHEIGHNHQSGDWTPGGTGEVTVNLFSLYVFETVCGVPLNETRKQLTPEWQRKAYEAYVAKGKSFEQWKSDPFLALAMYDQLRAKYGWDAYKKTIAEYRTLSDAERPKNDAEKFDQWMVRFSKTVGENLGPFFEAWGVTTSPEARKSIENLPTPKGLPDYVK